MPAILSIVDILYVETNIIDQLFATDLTLTTDDLDIDNEPHHGLTLRNGSQSALAIIGENGLVKPIKTKQTIGRISPRAGEQTIYINQLMNHNISMVIATGPAGTGKTLLAVSAALEIVINKGPQSRVIMCKSLSEIGPHRMGALPGGLKEKIHPYVACYEGAIDEYLGDCQQGMIHAMESKGIIEYRPINILRGTSIKDAIIILDEAQNINKHDMRAICTRVGENSRMFLLGDTRQSDEKYKVNGLKILTNSELIKKSTLVAHSNLIINQRSELSKLLDNALE